MLPKITAEFSSFRKQTEKKIYIYIYTPWKKECVGPWKETEKKRFFYFGLVVCFFFFLSFFVLAREGVFFFLSFFFYNCLVQKEKKKKKKKQRSEIVLSILVGFCVDVCFQVCWWPSCGGLGGCWGFLREKEKNSLCCCSLLCSLNSPTLPFEIKRGRKKKVEHKTVNVLCQKVVPEHGCGLSWPPKFRSHGQTHPEASGWGHNPLWLKSHLSCTWFFPRHWERPILESSGAEGFALLIAPGPWSWEVLQDPKWGGMWFPPHSKVPFTWVPQQQHWL